MKFMIKSHFNNMTVFNFTETPSWIGFVLSNWVEQALTIARCCGETQLDFVMILITIELVICEIMLLSFVEEYYDKCFNI